MRLLGSSARRLCVGRNTGLHCCDPSRVWAPRLRIDCTHGPAPELQGVSSSWQRARDEFRLAECWSLLKRGGASRNSITVIGLMAEAVPVPFGRHSSP